MNDVVVKLMPHQWSALNSTAKYTGIVSGLGSGKTFTGAHWVINKSFTHPNSLGFIGANTFSQLRDSTLRALFNELNRLKIPYKFNKTSGYLTINGKEWLCKSMDNYDVLRGVELGEFWLDECAYMKEEAIQVILGRLRDKKGSLSAFFTTTPKGYNWVYDYFHESGEKHNSEWVMVRANTRDNRHLPEGYIESLKSQYNERLLEQELAGEFVDLTSGKAYWAFDKEKNVKSFNPMKGTYQVGFDFNIDPFTCVIGYVYGDKIYIHDELFERNSTTPQMGSKLAAKHGKCVIIPDSTAHNRKTSGKTDIQMLKEQGHRVESTRNPFVIDRVNNVNRLLDKGRIIIHPKCKNLIADLEKVVWDKYGNLDQKTDKLRTHISDGLGYLAWKRMPMREEKTPAYTTWR
jgi:PBSX family phage terminase large subunit